MKERRGDEPSSIHAEVAGWLGFLIFVAAVYRLRRVLDRSTHEP